MGSACMKQKEDTLNVLHEDFKRSFKGSVGCVAIATWVVVSFRMVNDLSASRPRPTSSRTPRHQTTDVIVTGDLSADCGGLGTRALLEL